MLELHEITKAYGARTALDQVSFAVPAGSLTGFVGANGAGKTTAMRIVLGITEPDAGAVTWDGRPLDAELRRRIGYMPEERGLYPRMPVHKQLVYLARLHGLSTARAGERADELLGRLGLAERGDDHVDALSLGNQQRAQIAAALVHEPDLLLLDEPFSGLDPMAVDNLTGLLREVAATGVPVLFSSHQLELVERLCDAVVILSAGRVVAAGQVDELRRREGGAQLRLVLADDDTRGGTGGDASWVRDVAGVHVLDVDGTSVLLEVDDSAAQHALLTQALRRGGVRELSPVAPSLSELYRSAAQGQPDKEDVPA